MPATSYDALYDFETQIEDAIGAALETVGLTVHEQRGTDTLETPRVEIQFVNGAAQDEYARLPDGSQRPRSFSGTLGITLVTHRAKNDSVHGLWRGKVRRVLYDFKRTLEHSALPYLEIWRLQETASSPSVQTEDNNDISSMTWELRFAIRHNAWPQ